MIYDVQVRFEAKHYPTRAQFPPQLKSFTPQNFSSSSSNNLFCFPYTSFFLYSNLFFTSPYSAMEGSNEVFNQQPTTEDFNQPTTQRIALLKRLEEAIGSVDPHFWAACQVCHIQKLAQFVELAQDKGPGVARIVAAQTQPMIKYCK